MRTSTPFSLAPRVAAIVKPRNLIAPIVALVTLICWGLASPVGASPDDDFHMASIWCASGDRTSLCEQDTPTTRLVAADIIHTSTCYAFRPEQSAACQGQDFGDNPGTTVSTDRGNFDGLYPPVFYSVMSIFASPNLEASVIAIRIVNSLIFVTFIYLLYHLLPAHSRTHLTMPLLITLVPLGLFLIPSVNPSSWALLSGATLWVALAAYFDARTKRAATLLGLACLAATLIGAGSRADSAVYAGIAVVAVILLKAKFTKEFALKCILPGVLVAVSLMFYFGANQTNALDLAHQDISGAERRALFIDNLSNIPDLFAGVFGRWGLGWFDTGLPAVVWFLGLAAFLGTLFLSAGAGGARKACSSVFLLAALWLIPAIVLIQSNERVGALVQPRYILPLLIMFAGVCIYRSAHNGFSLNNTQKVFLVAALSLANSISMHINLRRYVTGTDHGGINLDAGAEWWWNINISPMAVWIAGSIAFFLTAAILVAAVPKSSERLLTSPLGFTKANDDALGRQLEVDQTKPESQA